MSQFFTSGGQSIGASASASSDCFPPLKLRASSLPHIHSFFPLSFTEFIILLLPFSALVVWSRGMWDLRSPTRDQTSGLEVES